MITAIKFIDYGDFDERNALGHNIGSFTAGEYVFSAGTSESILDSLLYIGMNVKCAYSSLYEVKSKGFPKLPSLSSIIIFS